MLKRVFLITFALVSLAMGTLIMILPTPDSRAEHHDTRADSSQNSFAITNTRVFDGYKVTENMQLIVRDGVITELASELDLPTDLPVIDGSNRTVLPGLIDAHTHNYGNGLVSSLRFGVTSTLDMFTDPGFFAKAKQQRDSMAKTLQTDIYSAGMLATAPGGHGTQFGVPVKTISSVNQVSDWVNDRVAEGSDYIKFVYIPGQSRIASIDRATAAELIRVAHEHNLLAVAHVSTLQAASDMLDDEVDGLVHLFADKKVNHAFLAKALESDLFIIPTLSVVASVDGQTFAKDLATDPLVKPYLDAQQRSTLNRSFNHKVTGFNFEIALHNIDRLQDAGVTLLAGSDAPNPGTAYGVSLHQEMQLLVKGGLSAVEALQAATSLPAAAFGLSGRGIIAPGARADLLLVNGNPAQNIRATRDIAFIIKNGYDVSRSLNAH